MTRLQTFILLASAALAPDLPASERNVANDVRTANHRYDLALVSADTAVLDALYLPEFTYIGPGGVVRDKEAQIHAISSGSVDVI